MATPRVLYGPVDTHFNHHVMVVEENSERRLMVDGVVMSRYEAGKVIYGRVWEYYLLLPYFSNASLNSIAQLLLLGLGAGTVPQLYSQVFPQMRILGVEIDEQVIQIAKDYFDLSRLLNLDILIEDAGMFLRSNHELFDGIIFDVFRGGVLPSWLITSEMIEKLHSRLTKNGVLLINFFDRSLNRPLVEQFGKLAKAYFASHFWLETPNGNLLYYGSVKSISVDAILDKMRDASWIPKLMMDSIGRQLKGEQINV